MERELMTAEEFELLQKDVRERMSRRENIYAKYRIEDKTKVELLDRCIQLEETNLDLQKKLTELNKYTDELLHTASKAVLLYKAEHGFIDYRAALAEIMQKCKERGIE